MSNIKVYVSGELEATTIEGIVAPTNAILDYSLNKKQSEINNEIKNKFQTIDTLILSKANVSQIPTKISELTNDSNFVNLEWVESKITESNQGDYNILVNKPQINGHELNGNVSSDILGIQTKEEGKGLSSNDFTTVEKTKLKGIAEGANNYIHPSSHPATMINLDTSHRFVSDTEKQTWNAKQDVLVSSTNIKTIDKKSILGSGDIRTFTKLTQLLYDGLGVKDEDMIYYIVDL